MFQNVSCSKFGTALKGIQKSPCENQGQPPLEFLSKLKDAGIPEDIISKGREAVEDFAKFNNIELPKPPEPPAGEKPDVMPPAGEKSQGAAHANKKSMLNRETSDGLKTVMEENNIPCSGSLKDDIAAIKTALKALDGDEAKSLKNKLQLAGLAVEMVDAKEASKKAFCDLNQLGALNKHMLVGKNVKKSI